jgi:hypothetical protein
MKHQLSVNPRLTQWLSLLLVAMASVHSSNAMPAPPSCVPAPSGLVGWWPGEGNANDVFGANNGMLENVTFTNGMVGQGFYLNGSNADVQIPDSASLKPASVTVETWVRLDALASPVAAYPGLQYIVFKQNTRDGDFEGYDIEKNRTEDGQDVFRFQVTSADGTQVPAASTTIPQIGVWYHLAGTYDSSSGYVNLYVNGVLEGSAYAGFPLDYGTRPVFIGTTGQSGWDGRVQGTVDEVSIYNRALSSDEIAAIYSAGSAGKCPGPFPPEITVQPTNQTVVVGGTATFTVMAGGTPPLSYQWNFNGTNISGATNTLLTLTNVQSSQAGNYAVLVTNILDSVLSSNAVLTANSPPPCVPAPSGLVGWWPGEGNANDVTGNNNGTLVNDVGFAPGEAGQAFSFDGVNSYVSIPDSPLLDSLTTSITVEAWIKVNQLTVNSDWVGIVTKGNSSWRLQATSEANTVTFSVNGASPNQDLTGGQNVNDGQWHYVAGVYDGANMSLYVDGTLDVSQPATGSIAQTSDPLCIAANAQAYVLSCSCIEPGYFFNGLIDEVSIYNRALAAQEIQAIYNAGISGKCPLGAPGIIFQPTNQTVALGGTAFFNVAAGGAGPLSYQWNFNGTNIDGETNTVLTLTDVQLNQAGNYTVLVTNTFGSVLSSNAVLTIAPDHFAWDLIPSPRFVNTPFAVTIRAQDPSNGIFTNFTGTAILSSTTGETITPSVSGNFVQGVWTGSVVISQTASSLVLQADDGLGDIGLANPIDVIELPSLEMFHSGNIALFIWPVGYSGFMLETSGNLSPATWVAVPYPPIQFGDEYFLPLNMTGTSGFYRLRFPGP